MVQSSNESQQTQTFSIDHENVLPEHYRLIELIGRGGMAEVYLAEDRRLGRKVAIKFLNPEFRRDPDRVRRFRQEARSASALNHPNILIIHDIGDRSGVQFIVSEFVEGETLGTRIAQGKIPFTDAVDFAIQAASALTAAHSAGIVHRDIKPDNVMIRADGVVKVLDFGLAKARGFSTANGAGFDALTLDSGSTSPGLIVGTPQYMSPEQARGKELDGRTDIFSLGIIVFEMVTRHSPFASGSFADTMAAILTKEPRRLEEFVADAPPRLVALIEKCLRKQRDERFSSMAEVESELKLLLEELVDNSRATAEVDPVKSDRTQIRPTDQHSIRRFVSDTFRKPSPIAAGIILVAAALLVGGWWAWDRVSLRSAVATSLMRTVPITSWSSSASELVSAASFSPDGKLIAFAALKGESTEIWVKPVIGGDPVQVTKNGGYNQYPIWSPDGQNIAFFSDRGGGRGIWRIPFTGGDQSRIVGNLSGVTRPLKWNPDGSIVFHARPDLFKTTEGSEPQRLTFFANGDARPQTIISSPDQRTLAYSINDSGIWNVKLAALDGGSEKIIASSEDVIDNIAWHPNGKSLFFSLTIEGTLQIFESDLNGGDPIQRTNGDLNYLVHDVSANGSVLYGSTSETSDLWRVDTADATESIVANEVPSEFWPDISRNGSIAYQSVSHVDSPDSGWVKVVGPGPTPAIRVLPNGFMPIWSHGGDRIAFLHPKEAAAELWLASNDGIDTRKISNTASLASGYAVSPYLKSDTTQLAWSSDDTQIVFPTLQDTVTRLYISSTDGSMVGRFLVSNPSTGHEREPIWLPNGQQLIYRSQDRLDATPSSKWIHRIRIVDVASGQQRQLFESLERVRVLGLSVDGSEIIFIKKTDATSVVPYPPETEVYSLSINDGRARKVQTLGYAHFLNIHLDAKADLIAFVASNASKTSLRLTRIGSDTSRELLSFNDPKIMISSLEISPDGSFIVFGKQTRTSLLSMLTE